MIRLLLIVSATAALVSCTSSTGGCPSCDGCCDIDGTCKPGTSLNACGVSGSACNVCTSGEGCNSGTCSSGSSGGGAANGGGDATGGGDGTGGGIDQDTDPTCDVCSTDADCTTANTQCTHYAGGTFCGRSCGSTADCTSIETCLNVQLASGSATARVCVPLSGTCSDTGCGACTTGTCDIVLGKCVGGGTGGGSAGTGGGSGGGLVTGAALTIIVEPSDNAAALRAAITNATTSVHMTMYLLSNNGIINALLAQKAAGHEVEVVLNQNFPTGGSNQSVYTQLQNGGVSVHWAPSTFTLTHEKCVIIDGKTAWIMTMNATATSPSSNREYLAVDNVAADVAEAEKIFQADFASMSITPSGPLLVAPVNPESRMVAALDAAATTIDMEGEELSDGPIVDSMVSARSRGVAVQIVLADTAPTSAQSTAVTKLKAAGVKLVSLHAPYMHAKSFVIDSKQAYIGSENFTAGSLLHNRELGLIFTVASEVQKVLTTSRTDFSNGTAL